MNFDINLELHLCFTHHFSLEFQKNLYVRYYYYYSNIRNKKTKAQNCM